MKELAAALEAKWKTNHFKTAEEAFERVAVDGQSAAGPSFFKKAEVPTPMLKTSRKEKVPATVLSAKKIEL